jgi:hypothetical protein
MVRKRKTTQTKMIQLGWEKPYASDKGFSLLTYIDHEVVQDGRKVYIKH